MTSERKASRIPITVTFRDWSSYLHPHCVGRMQRQKNTGSCLLVPGGRESDKETPTSLQPRPSSIKDTLSQQTIQREAGDTSPPRKESPRVWRRFATLPSLPDSPDRAQLRGKCESRYLYVSSSRVASKQVSRLQEIAQVHVRGAGQLPEEGCD